MRANQPQPVLVAGCPGWLHLPAGGAGLSAGVVLCGPEAHELIPTRRALHELAQRCAEAGLPALRIDPPGCGDHPAEEAPGQLVAWRDTLLAAADWLTAEVGVTEVALCGLRFGALVAVQAAATRPGRFASLALLAPVASGCSHWRVLALAGQPSADGARIELGGHRMHRADLDVMADWDLRQAAGAAPRLLLMERGSGTAARRPAGATALRFDGIEQLLTHPHLARMPAASFGRVAAWLADGATRMRALAMPGPPPALGVGGGATENAIRFGRGNALTGVLCRPAAGCARPVAVLFLNAGANPRGWSGRFAVRSARALARLGITSLRLDAPGVGDSDPVENAGDAAGPPDMFRPGLAEDVRAGIDELHATGAARCLVAGICAGADTALRLAVSEAAVDGIALFNLPAFDRTQGGAPALDGGPPPGEIPWLRRPRMLLRRLRAETDRLLASFGIEAGLDRPGGWMRALDARGTRVLLAYSAGDRGLRELRAHFGRNGRRLAGMAGMRCVILDGADHAMTQRAAQDRALRLIEEEILRLDPADSPPWRMAASRSRAPSSAPPRSVPAG
jgi:pimeloyl-ACP methyl ester carboxylesterase